MRRRWLKWTALALSAAMLCSTAGCGSQTEGTSGTASEAGSAAGSEAAAENGEDEVVTLTMFIRNQSKYTGLQEDPVAQYIEDKLGVRIELTVDSSLGNTTAPSS